MLAHRIANSCVSHNDPHQGQMIFLIPHIVAWGKSVRQLCYTLSMNWFNDTPLGRAVKSYIKVFVSVVIGMFLADGADVFSVDATDLRTWLAAGLAATLPLLVTALDPSDTRFGTETVTEEPAVEEFSTEDYTGE